MDFWIVQYFPSVPNIHYSRIPCASKDLLNHLANFQVDILTAVDTFLKSIYDLETLIIFYKELRKYVILQSWVKFLKRRS